MDWYARARTALSKSTLDLKTRTTANDKITHVSDVFQLPPSPGLVHDRPVSRDDSALVDVLFQIQELVSAAVEDDFLLLKAGEKLVDEFGEILGSRPVVGGRGRRRW